MRAIVLGYHDMGCVGIESLLVNDFEITAVFTHTDAENENLWFRSVAELAARRSIPTFAPEDINHPLWVNRIRELKPDILFSFYYRKLIGSELLAVPTVACLMALILLYCVVYLAWLDVRPLGRPFRRIHSDG